MVAISNRKRPPNSPALERLPILWMHVLLRPQFVVIFVATIVVVVITNVTFATIIVIVVIATVIIFDRVTTFVGNVVA